MIRTLMPLLSAIQHGGHIGDDLHFFCPGIAKWNSDIEKVNNWW